VACSDWLGDWRAKVVNVFPSCNLLTTGDTPCSARFAGWSGFLRESDERLKEIRLVGRLLQCRANLQPPNRGDAKPCQCGSNSTEQRRRIHGIECWTPRDEEMALPTRISGFDGDDVFHGDLSPNENKISRRRG